VLLIQFLFNQQNFRVTRGYAGPGPPKVDFWELLKQDSLQAGWSFRRQISSRKHRRRITGQHLSCYTTHTHTMQFGQQKWKLTNC